MTEAPVGEHRGSPALAQGDIAQPRLDARALSLLRDGWIFGVFVAIVIGFSIASPNFLTQANWLNTSSTATEVLLLAVGQTFVIVSGGIDLSVGATLGLSGMVSAWVMAHFFAGGSTPGGVVTAIGFIVAILVGMLAGAVNGTLISRYAIPPFVVTLGTLGIGTASPTSSATARRSRRCRF